MKDSPRYPKVISWSDEDQFHIGRASDLMDGGCHGDDERSVLDKLSGIVEEIIQFYYEEGKELPPPTLDHDLAVQQ